VAATIIFNVAERRRHRSIARTRPPVDPSTFIQLLLDRGVQRDTAKFLNEKMRPYYHPPLTPHPDDRTSSTLRIDPEDLGDMAEDFCQDFEVPKPPQGRSVTMPDDPSLTELAVWLDTYRDAQAAR